jgi:hypothetical protein
LCWGGAGEESCGAEVPTLAVVLLLEDAGESEVEAYSAGRFRRLNSDGGGIVLACSWNCSPAEMSLSPPQEYSCCCIVALQSSGLRIGNVSAVATLLSGVSCAMTHQDQGHLAPSKSHLPLLCCLSYYSLFVNM